MRRLALGVAATFALMPAAAGAQQNVAAAVERWFAIAWENGSRHHLGPFESLEACENGRLNPKQAPNGNAGRLGFSSTTIDQMMNIFWKDRGICERF
jgi:hypothetical protein